VPYIDNSRITVLPEDEIILPRGIVLKIDEKYKENMEYETINGLRIPVITLYASYNNENLLDKRCIKNYCKNFKFITINTCFISN